MATVTKVELEGFRSIRNRSELYLEPSTTVLLGANDHGKSNLLRALLHLNEDAQFDEDLDLNWDCRESSERLPLARYTVSLDPEEVASISRQLAHEAEQSALSDYRARWAARANELDGAVDGLEAGLEQLDVEYAGIADALDDATIGTDEAEVARATAEKAAEERASLLEQLGVVEAESQYARLRASHAALSILLLDGVLPDVDALAPYVEDLAVQLESAEKDLSEALAAVGEARGQLEATQPGDEAAIEDGNAKVALLESEARAKASRVDASRKNLSELRTALRAIETGIVASEWDDPHDPFPTKDRLTVPEQANRVVLSRSGVGNPLHVEVAGELQPVPPYLREVLPRVEIIEAQGALSDSVTAKTIQSDANEFMRGIFYYAGLEQAEWANLFQQNLRSTKRLDVANRVLNETLQKAWTQGADLEFKLDHNADSIELMLGDPAVSDTYVRASRRSSGFTHFFALKTVLYARQCEAPAKSYLWLFDEPGVYLHPEGQHDLLRVLEALSTSNQLVYTTHSIFLLNKNHPTRHRLVQKSDRGTTVDPKPYLGRWNAAIEALGLALPGTILFASVILLAEGDSDAILLGADLEKLIDLQVLDIDLNPLSILGTGDSENADALIRILSEGTPSPRMALLVDGDQGGRDRKAALKDLLADREIEVIELKSGTATEDHLLSPDLFIEAVIQYLTLLATDRSIDVDVDARMKELLDGEYKGESLAAWSRYGGQKTLGLSSPPSSVGFARQYAQLLLEDGAVDKPPSSRARSVVLAKRIAEKLDLASAVAEPRIVSS